MRASLARLRISIDVPAVSPETIVRPEPPLAARPVPVPKPPPTGTDAEPKEDLTPWRRVTLAQLIEAGMVRLPFDLQHRYKGRELTARIESVDRIIFGDRAFESVSLAGGMARKSVVGAPPGREYPQTNGWTFWEYRRSDG